MRPRFKRSIIASSDAYKVHSHYRMLQENHETYHEYLEHIQVTVKIEVHKTPYVRVFGEIMQITLKEAEKLPNYLVIWK